ncbi:MAG: 2-C-methyl-D-erythritol 2,4-cyclodiphosphate synthase [Candidatus Cloacimonas sp. SDB]|nr:MAG: 2-C-methyl-D-erythritol 2,4-cyclodiphosphate synthase [Candidatus Cloacimonas sp. SDB]
MRIGFGYDVHRLVKNRILFLGGVKIEHDKGLLGHSDADVVLHAVIDSVLGALAKGDIGTHFPDNDAEFKNINSRLLLQKITDIMQIEGFKIGNLDVTVCIEKPKLKEYIPLMRKNLAADLNCDINLISVKATTEEGLGVSGKSAGISAYAVVLLKSL